MIIQYIRIKKSEYIPLGRYSLSGSWCYQLLNLECSILFLSTKWLTTPKFNFVLDFIGEKRFNSTMLSQT